MHSNIVRERYDNTALNTCYTTHDIVHGHNQTDCWHNIRQMIDSMHAMDMYVIASGDIDVSLTDTHTHSRCASSYATRTTPWRYEATFAPVMMFGSSCSHQAGEFID